MNIVNFLIVSEPKFKSIKSFVGCFNALIESVRGVHCKGDNYEKCYRILELPNGADQSSVRGAFINLCKKYHPDSGSAEADAGKFQEVDTCT